MKRAITTFIAVLAASALFATTAFAATSSSTQYSTVVKPSGPLKSKKLPKPKYTIKLKKHQKAPTKLGKGFQFTLTVKGKLKFKLGRGYYVIVADSSGTQGTLNTATATFKQTAVKNKKTKKITSWVLTITLKKAPAKIMGKHNFLTLVGDHIVTTHDIGVPNAKGKYVQ